MIEQTPPQPPARRPRRRSQRQIEESATIKAEIVTAASEVFAENGYALTTLDAVAKRVGLGRTGLLHHFPSKEALFLAVLDREREWAQERAGGETGTTGLDTIRELGVFLGRDAAARTPLQLVHVLEGEAIAGNEAAARYVAERLVKVRDEIRRRLEHETPAEDLETVVTLVAATINGLQKIWLLEPDAPTIPAFELLMDLLDNQLTTD
ncbi:TetR family transcriptional regulator [Lentzea pudingi]|uniref:TetR family transcriptional regulator n=1 Tax=Lentzea pudingi TaxID=1789439 RepID=A0ABQ2HXW3_9PSEU|nr:TetR/AcrR family transcriptional regulator [Lentzea pudingi]GGM94870.1 TetR family transcriptional regulator [Lentzea pudingi]